MKREKLTQLALVGPFLILLAIPHFVELSGMASSTSANEKRVMAARPDTRLLFASFSDYARQFDRFYNDSFGLRDGLIRWNNRLRLFIFNESPVRGVRVGREGWFFYADEWVLEDYENAMPLPSPELDTIVQNLEKKRDWLEARGIELLVLAVPEKHTIYSEYLPPSIHKLGRESRLDQLAGALKSHPKITFIDSREPLLKAKATARLYHRTDSHWNDYGALIAYGALMEPIARRFPAVPVLAPDDYAVSTAVGYGGDLAGMLSLSDVIREERITLVPKFTPRAVDGARPYPNPVDPAVYPGRDMVVKETGDPSLPKALVFRDSFSGPLIPFLSESFRSVVFVWTFDFLPELIEQEKPDIVIIECVERYLTGLTRYTH